MTFLPFFLGSLSFGLMQSHSGVLLIWRELAFSWIGHTFTGILIWPTKIKVMNKILKDQLAKVIFWVFVIYNHQTNTNVPLVLGAPSWHWTTVKRKSQKQKSEWIKRSKTLWKQRSHPPRCSTISSDAGDLVIFNPIMLFDLPRTPHWLRIPWTFIAS